MNEWMCVEAVGKVLARYGKPGDTQRQGKAVHRERMSLKELKEVTRDWLRYYNGDRPHQALGYRTPDEVYYGHRVAV